MTHSYYAESPSAVVLQKFWTEPYVPDLLGLTLDELDALSDDGVGRALGCLFRCEQGAFVLDVVRHTIREFEVTLHFRAEP